MKRIGIIGGLSYESSVHYYEQLNRLVNMRVGGLASADMILRSVNFGDYYRMMEAGDWGNIGQMLMTEAFQLFFEDYCDYVAVASCTMHKMAPLIEKSLGQIVMEYTPLGVKTPFIHIGDCIADACAEIGAHSVLFLGTKITMTEDFMRERLARDGIEVTDTSEYGSKVDEVNRIIFDELCRGRATTKSWNFLLDFIHQFPTGDKSRPDAVVLGCTELGLILQQDDVDIPLIDSTAVHVRRLAELATI
ncbi:amino acid racemase [Candidatus Saccharibacteria bacterium]|nr:amino acid racemase [Candidatus Saccharibacteria bacterium]